METWLFILILCLGMQLIFSIYALLKMWEGYGYALLPNEIHDTSNITWFGAIFVFLLLFILMPFLYLFGLIKLMFTGRWFE